LPVTVPVTVLRLVMVRVTVFHQWYVPARWMDTLPAYARCSTCSEGRAVWAELAWLRAGFLVGNVP